jgi:hypothetical protein
LVRLLPDAILDPVRKAEIDVTAANGREALAHGNKQLAPRKKETKWLISRFMEI